MYLLYCDESNLEERSGDFLIYSGLMIHSSKYKDFSQAIDRIRSEAKIEKEFKLKFNPKPSNLSHIEFIDLKQKIIELAIEFDLGLFTYLILHDISSSPDEARRNGINTLCYNFNCVLSSLKESGLVMIDRFNDNDNLINSHLTEKFCLGVSLPFTPQMRLSNILGFHYSAIGQSHLPSVVDIVLGSLRFSINTFTRKIEENLPTAKTILKIISPLFIRIETTSLVSELSCTFSPKVINWPNYLDKYKALKLFLEDSGISTEQPITNNKRY